MLEFKNISEDALVTAAIFGYKDAVAHLYESGVEMAGFNNQIARRAAAGGHLDTIEYMYNNHMFEAAGYNAYGAAMQAAANGQLDVLKFLYDAGIKIELNKDSVMIAAAKDGHLNTLQYLHEVQGFNLFAADNNIMRAAVGAGKLDVIKYLESQGVDFRGCQYALAETAANGHLDTIKYLYKSGVSIIANNNMALQMAIANNHISVVKYLHQNGADLSVLIELNGAIDNSYAMSEAVHKGYEDILEYLRNQGIYTDKSFVIDVISELKKRNPELNDQKLFVFQDNVMIEIENEDGEPECYQLLQINTEYPRDVETGLNVDNMMELFGHCYEYMPNQEFVVQEDYESDEPSTQTPEL